MGLSRLEQEVVINFNAEENIASIYTANPTWIRKMDKLVEKNPDEFKMVREGFLEGELISKTYECPKKLISIRSGITTRQISEEQRKASAERLRQMRNKKSY